VLVPSSLLDSYQLPSNLSMRAPPALAQFSSNGARFARFTQERQLPVWDIATGNTLISQEGSTHPRPRPTAVSFSVTPTITR
jgi:hypothetical protein